MVDRPTGKLVYLDEPEEIQIKEHEVPEPGPNGILTEVVRANVCGSELHIWKGLHPEVKEGVLGHEALCRVSELGANVDTDYAGEPVAEGDLIAPAYFITCRKCAACQRGQFNLCENAYENWSKPPEEPPHFHGTFGTHYFVHPDQYFYKVPEGLAPGIAAGANCALSQVLYGIDEIGVASDDTVVVQGAGGLGLNAIAVANERGAETIVVEGVDRRLNRAEAFGVRRADRRPDRRRRCRRGYRGGRRPGRVRGGHPPRPEGRPLPRNGERQSRTDGRLRPRTVDSPVDPDRVGRPLRPVVSA